MGDVLKLENLHVTFETSMGLVHAVRGISLTVHEGEVLALVGESGCGKSVTAQSILALHPPQVAHVSAARLELMGDDILHASEKKMEKMRGNHVCMVFQDPLNCLNPTMKIGKQITETLFLRKIMTREECKKEAIRLLELVQIPQAVQRAQQYPHQFSGGMRQRAMIAMALARQPKLLIADEPTTALDVTTQFQILLLLRKIRKEMGMAVLLITHDLGVVASMADRVAVMYAGKLAEEGKVRDIFFHAAHPYTQGLLESIPTQGSTRELFSIPGAPPDLYTSPPGCAFAKRCVYSMRVCMVRQPCEFSIHEGHVVSCWRFHPGFKERG